MAPAKPVVELLKPLRGIVGRYRVVAVADAFGAAGDEGLAVDLGFKLYLPLSPAQARFRTKGEIVNVDAAGGVTTVGDAKPADLFTYDVTVRRVVDGDTLEVAIALLHLVHRLKLRLRGLDCPEMDTPEGKAAKRVVESLMRDAKSVIVYTSKPDKYDRHLADVFITTADGTEVFLNNHLFENGYAERKDAWEFGDWNFQPDACRASVPGRLRRRHRRVNLQTPGLGSVERRRLQYRRPTKDTKTILRF